MRVRSAPLVLLVAAVAPAQQAEPRFELYGLYGFSSTGCYPGRRVMQRLGDQVLERPVPNELVWRSTARSAEQGRAGEKITLAAAAARSRASSLDPSALNSTVRTPKGRLDCGTARKRSGPEPSARDP